MLATILVIFAAIVLKTLILGGNDKGRVFACVSFGAFLLVQVLSYIEIIPPLALRLETLQQNEWLQFRSHDFAALMQTLSLIVLCGMGFFLDTFLPDNKRPKLPYSFYYMSLLFITLLASYQQSLISLVCLFELIFMVEIFAIRDKSLKFIIKRKQMIYGFSIALVALMYFFQSPMSGYSDKSLGIVWATWFFINAFLKNASLIDRNITHRPGLAFTLEIAKYFLLSIFAYTAFNQSEIFSENEKMVVMSFLLIGTFLSLFRRERKIDYDKEVGMLKTLSVGVFTLTTLVSILGSEHLSEMGSIFILYCGIGSMVALYSHKISEIYSIVDKRIHSFIFLLPLLFILGLPFTFSHYFYSKVWMLLYLSSLPVLLASLLIFLIVYTHFIRKFKSIFESGETISGNVNMGQSKAGIWLVYVFFFSLLSIVLVNFYR